ncbi:MAG: glycosyltransferase family 4 protein [Gelidibacter sp.]
MKPSILYIGNDLSLNKSNVSIMSTFGPLLAKEGYKVYFASSKKDKSLRLMDMLFKVIRYSHQVNFVLIDTYSTQNFYYALLVSQLCRLFGLRYIPILHGGNLPNRLNTHPVMSASIFKHAFCNVAPSKYLKEQFEAYGYINLKYIPNMIEIQNYHFFLNRDFTLPKLLWVRSFSKIYNPLMALKVLKSLKDLGYDATLCMVGPDTDGSLAQVEELAESLSIQVKLTGKLTKKEWAKLSEDHNVFINTTDIDNTPVSVMEAMALGLPIVSTNVGGMPYLVDHGINGLLVEKNNVDDMVKAILYLFNEPEKRKLMILNARKLSETFDWQQIKMKWNEILQN